MSDAGSEKRGYRLRGRWVVALLGVSLLLNIFFLASVFGHKFRGRGPGGPPGHHACGPGDGVREFTREDKELRKLARKLRRELRDKNRAGLQEKRAALHNAHAALVEALSATPLDAARLEQTQAAYLEARRDIRGGREEWLRLLAGNLTPEQRKALAARMAEKAKCRKEYWDRRLKRADKDKLAER